MFALKCWNTMKEQKGMLTLLLFCLCAHGIAQNSTIFKETFGNYNGSRINISNCNDTMWDNGAPIIYSGTGGIIGAGSYSDYDGASGNAHAFLAGGQSLAISGIPIAGYTDIQLAFGVAGDASILLPPNPNTLAIEYSFDGIGYTATDVTLTLPRERNAWIYVSSVSIPTGNTATLFIRFRNTRSSSTTAGFRIDDVELTGILMTADNAHLHDLTVSSGTLMPAFDSAVFSYMVTLPYATTVVPTVSASPFDTRASVSISQATAFTEGNNQASVAVTAPDSIHTQIYTVDFFLAEPSSNASLGNIALNGITIPDFNADVLNYYIELNDETPTMPIVVVSREDEYAEEPEIIYPDTLPGIVYIKGVAQNGNTRTYKLHLYPLRSFLETFDEGETSTTQLSETVHTFKHRWIVKGCRRNNSTTNAEQHGFSLQFMRGQASAYMELKDPLPNGIGQISFDYMSPMEESETASFKLRYRTQGGVWTDAVPDGQETADITINNSSQVSHVTYSLNVREPSFIRIDRVSSTNYPRVNFDNIKITDYSNMWVTCNWDNGDPFTDSVPTVIIRDSLIVPVSKKIHCNRLIIEDWGALTVNEGAEIHANSIEGKVSFQKNLLPKRWNHIAIPVGNATFGPFISERDSAAICLMTYEGVTGNFGDQWSDYITGANTSLNPLVGYAAYTNRDSICIYLKGAPNNSTEYTLPLVARERTGADNWYLIPNPYPFTLKGSSIAAANHTFLQGDGAAIIYETENGNDTVGKYSVRTSFPDMPPLSSLFVARRADMDSIGMVLNKQQSLENITQQIITETKYAGIEASLKGNSSKIFLRYETNADTLIDRYDMDKFFSGNPTIPDLYTIVSETPLSINSFSGDRADFPLEIYIDTATDIILSFQDFDSAFPDSMHCELRDALTQQTYDLRNVDSVTVGLTQGNNAHRFTLHFLLGNTSSLSAVADLESVSCKMTDGLLQVITPQPATIEITNILGQVSTRMQQEGGKHYHELNLPKGAYIVKIAMKGEVFSEKIIL